MKDTSRRQFLRASTAAAVPLLGVETVGASDRPLAKTRALQQEDVPGYADWIPADDIVLDENGEIAVGSFDVGALLETFAAEQEEGGEDDSPDPLPMEAFFFNVLSAAFGWGGLDEVGLSEPIIGQDSQTATENPNLEDVPADRQTSVGNTSVYTGSFDTDALATLVDGEAFEETDTQGVYRFETVSGEQFVTWEEGYIAIGSGLEELEVVIAAGTGDAPSKHEESPDMGQLLGAGGQGDFVFARLAEGETLVFEGEGGDFFDLDYSPLEGAQGYIHSNWVDIEAEQFDAVTVAGFASEDAIDMDRLGQIGADATEQDISRDGRFVTVETRYEGEALIGTPDDGPDDSPDDDNPDDGQDNGTDDGTDDGAGETEDGDGGVAGDDETEDDSTDGNETEDDGMDDNDTGSDGADDDGAGFGVLAALSGIGGIGYMLSRRLSPGEE